MVFEAKTWLELAIERQAGKVRQAEKGYIKYDPVNLSHPIKRLEELKRSQSDSEQENKRLIRRLNEDKELTVVDKFIICNYFDYHLSRILSAQDEIMAIAEYYHLKRSCIDSPERKFWFLRRAKNFLTPLNR